MAKEKTAEVKDNKKDQLLEEALKTIEKEYGKGSIMRLGDRANVAVDAISSGSLTLDAALGIGGFPKGRIIEIYGPESSGKTTLALHAIAECQKAGGRCAFIDAENAIDPVYAKHLGVNIDELLLSQPDSGEQALDICEVLVKSGAVDLVVVDSVAALVPRAELEGEMGDSSVGLQARLMSKAMRKLAGVMNHSETTAIFINQLREKVGVIYGSPETTPGGRALKFYASVRLDVRRTDTLREGQEAYANVVKVKVVKNKVAPPFRMAVVTMVYGEGISHIDEVINLAVDHNLLDKSGAWFSYQGEKIGQGVASARSWLKSHPEIDAELTRQLREILFNPKTEEAQAAS
ncbi:MAG: recombinase RecA [Bulleidia sp.]